ncbi:hypothetical protein EV284_6423 [Streptomyces sp. BK022]|uniref:hypothetical protein n=1 Tax=Streptomyces sp. BK022 TaxID=2512123 RepID=UPI001028DE51|nr:hypothetical protein [Streptomyces sp. BK022]RZU28257.1 hypothetical protein EV284_6423 [Streptomyces sp. BK022]
MPEQQHALVAPEWDGGAFVFTHTYGSGISVWARNLGAVIAESPRPRGVAAPLYAGTIADMKALADFVADFVEHATGDEDEGLRLGRVRDTKPIVQRTHSDSPASRMHFSYRSILMDTVGPWDGAAAELLLARVRGGHRGHVGFFATGLPEFPADAPLDVVPYGLPRAVIDRGAAADLADFLSEPPGRVLPREVADRCR